MFNEKYDCSGWATRVDIKCSDGRTIRHGAFSDDDGKIVPVVWQHDHNDPMNVLGHALLKDKTEGTYAFISFNDTEIGQTAKDLVAHGDIRSLSIYANKLKQSNGDVLHGSIREVSLVLAGANPGAIIDVPVISHSEDGQDVYADEAFIYFDQPLDIPSDEIQHKEAEEDEQVKPDDKEDKRDRTVGDVFNTFTDEQKNVFYYMLQEMSKSGAQDDKEDEESEDNDEGDDEEMKHNVFDNEEAQGTTLSHSDIESIFADAKRCGSLKTAAENFAEKHNLELAHAVTNEDGSEQTYGIANIDYLFPDYKNVTNQPGWIKRADEWVETVMGGVHHTPFSRVKSVFANITMDEARAKGYTKGNRKIEEVFSLLKRTTSPQTVYKKQKLDRDDVIDIVDFDVVAWLKSEMRMMLDEELARAYLIGDGRLSTDDDHISEDHIRPIWGDDPLYTITASVAVGASDDVTAKNMIKTVIRQRKNYKGSGNLIAFMTEDWLTEMLLLEDGIGHPLYADEAALARKLRVNRIVTVPVMENQTKNGQTLAMILVDLKDYNVGADRGGAVALFDDFDIDYNAQKYLIETRCSGALIKPYSAIVITTPAAASEESNTTEGE